MRELVVPDLSGLTQLQAWQKLRQLGHAGPVWFAFVNSYGGSAEISLVADSKVGQPIRASSPFTIKVVAAHFAAVKMPAVTGMTPEDAIAALTAAGVHTFNLKYKRLDDAPKGCKRGRVCSQDPAPGEPNGESSRIYIGR